MAATTSATIEIEIHNNKIVNELKSLYSDGEKIANTTAFEQYYKRMDKSELHARMELDAT